MLSSLSRVTARAWVFVFFLGFLIAIGVTLDLSNLETLVKSTTSTPVLDEALAALVSPDQIGFFLLAWLGLSFLLIAYRCVVGKLDVGALPFGLFLAFSMVAGYALDTTGDIAVMSQDPIQVAKNICAFLAWSVVGYCTFALLFDACSRYFSKRRTTAPQGRAYPRFVAFVFERHAVVGPCVVVCIAWLPVIIGYAPGLFMGDTVNQLQMWYGMENPKSQMVNLLDESVTLTGHYPVLHTVLLGACVQFGVDVLGNANAGMFAYSIVQTCGMLFAIGYAMKHLAELGVSVRMRIALTVLFAVVPWYPSYAMLTVREGLFSAALLVFCIALIGIASGDSRRSRWVTLALAGVLATLMKNGAIIMVMAGYLALLVQNARRHGASGGVFAPAMACVGSTLAFFLLFTFALLPALHVTPGNKVEMLSIPFQQTARYVRDHDGQLTESEQDAVDKVLGFDGLAERYNPLTSDPVKDYAAFNRHDAGLDDYLDYFGAWLSMGLKDPGCYVAATMHNYYGYFYLSNRAIPYYSYAWSKTCIDDTNGNLSLGFHHAKNAVAKLLAGVDDAYIKTFRAMPVLNLLLMPALWCWLVLVCLAVAIRNRRELVLPALVSILCMVLIFLAGPCNGASYTRYAFPIGFVLPFVIAVEAGRHRTEDPMHWRNWRRMSIRRQTPGRNA